MQLLSRGGGWPLALIFAAAGPGLLLPACGRAGGGEADGDAGEDARGEEPEDVRIEEAVDEPRAEDGVEDVREAAEEPVPDDVEADEAAEAELPFRRLFSFAIITDTHIGEGYDDYGTEGFDDGGGDEYEITGRLREAVAKVNANIDLFDIRFVMSLGDFSDSAETSELVRSREIHDDLEVPYVPLIGNHDMWPYVRGGGGEWVEAEGPTGDAVFDRVFASAYEAAAVALPAFEKAETPVYNPQIEGDSFFVNLAFDFEGYHFIGLDLGTRGHADRKAHV